MKSSASLSPLRKRSDIAFMSGTTVKMMLSKYGRRWPFLSTSKKYGLRSSRAYCAGLYSLMRNGPLPTMSAGFQFTP